MIPLSSHRQLIFTDEENERESISVTICETIPSNRFDSSSYAFYLWPCAPILAQYIWFNRNEYLGKNILEVRSNSFLMIH